MQAEVASPRGKPYFYYRCVGVKQGKADRCGIRTHYRAEEVEADVWDGVRGLYGDKELLQRKIREEFACKRAELSGPSVDVDRLKERLGELDRAERRWNDAYEADVINVAELKAHRARIYEERAAIERTLEHARSRDIDLLELERQERDILDRLDSQVLGEADSWTPEERASVYKNLQLRVTLGTAGRHMIFPNFFVDPPQWIKGVRTSDTWPRPRCRPTLRYARP